MYPGLWSSAPVFPRLLHLRPPHPSFSLGLERVQRFAPRPHFVNGRTQSQDLLRPHSFSCFRLCFSRSFCSPVSSLDRQRFPSSLLRLGSSPRGLLRLAELLKHLSVQTPRLTMWTCTPAASLLGDETWDSAPPHSPHLVSRQPLSRASRLCSHLPASPLQSLRPPAPRVVMFPGCCGPSVLTPRKTSSQLAAVTAHPWHSPRHAASVDGDTAPHGVTLRGLIRTQSSSSSRVPSHASLSLDPGSGCPGQPRFPLPPPHIPLSTKCCWFPS